MTCTDTIRLRQITTVGELATHLAHIARQIRDILIHHHHMPAQQADSDAQTIVYTMFATATSDHPHPPAGNCVQSIDRGMHSVAGAGAIPEVATCVSACRDVLEHTDMVRVCADIGSSGVQCDPVVHFYEHFLHAYNPHQRAYLGVYATPEPVVSYMVRSVDHLLQQSFPEHTGLVDARTFILDPSVGTGSFLCGVVEHIYHRVLSEPTYVDVDWSTFLQSHILPRMIGFELLPTPLAIAQSKLATLLHARGCFPIHCEPLHPVVHLADALDVFDPLAYAQSGLGGVSVSSPPTLVVLGNPPYAYTTNAYTNVNDKQLSHHHQRAVVPLLRDYYSINGDTLHERNPKWLQDEYVKFIRLAQHYVVQVGRGIVAFITNNSYLDNPTFRGMRHHLRHDFECIYVLNVHGNSKKRERGSHGERDENVFHIQQGVAIAFFVKHPDTPPVSRAVYYADVWGSREEKYAFLTAHDVTTTDWHHCDPVAPWYLFVPHNAAIWDEYASGWKVTDVMPVQSVGIVTGQDKATIAFTHEEAVALAHTHQLDTQTILPIHYRPFDVRYIVYDASVVTRPRVRVMRHMMHIQNNLGLVFQRGQNAGDDISPPQVTTHLIDQGLAYPANRALARLAPLYFVSPSGSTQQVNLAPLFIAALEQRLSLTYTAEPRGDLRHTCGCEDIFCYIYALLHASAYRQRYAEQMKLDVPRIPIIRDRALFAALVEHGTDLIEAHLFRGASPDTVSFHAGTAVPVCRVCFQAPDDQHRGRVVVADDLYFEGIDRATWTMRSGGYRPLVKWLKDRTGRLLSRHDVQHYAQMVEVLQATRRITDSLDTLVSQWPIGM